MDQTDALTFAGLYASEAIEAGLVSKTGVKHSLLVSALDDFETEVFKSDTAFTSIPEIGLEIPDGLSRFTTVGLLLRDIEQNLRNSPALPGLDKFLLDLGECLSGAKTFHLVIEDALGLSTVQPPAHRLGQLTTERTRRKASDDIYFGLDRESVLGSQGASEDARETLARLVRNAHKIAILSGAGISTESGVPAFRSPDGMDNLWDRYNANDASSNFGHSDYWAMHSELYDLVFGGNVLPNASHKLAVELDRRGKLQMVITQNIDGLYQASGLALEKLLEIHGSVTTCRCSHCGKAYDRMKAHEAWKASLKVPLCDDCKSPLRFGTVGFGESLDVDILQKAKEAIKNCDLLIIMGSALVEQPANKLPEIALDSGSIPVALLNLGPTPLDNVVDLLISDKCGSVSQYVLDHLDDADAQNEEPFAPDLNISQLAAAGLVEGIEHRQLQLASFFYRLRR